MLDQKFFNSNPRTEHAVAKQSSWAAGVLGTSSENPKSLLDVPSDVGSQPDFPLLPKNGKSDQICFQFNQVFLEHVINDHFVNGLFI
jgi:hypothetical protein